jgi:hypothetical protein
VAAVGQVAVSDVLRRPAPEAWRGFLQEWYGIDGSAGVVPLVAMPRALRDFYEFAGTAIQAFVVNDMLVPDEILTDTGHRVFNAEEQGVWLWGIAEAEWLGSRPAVGRRSGIEEWRRGGTALVGLLDSPGCPQAPSTPDR